jgi:hypothetical protein
MTLRRLEVYLNDCKAKGPDACLGAEGKEIPEQMQRGTRRDKEGQGGTRRDKEGRGGTRREEEGMRE